MRDVTGQLADYFDATVERITPEDVCAGSEGRYPNPRFDPTPRHRLRPAWVVAVAFMTTIVVFGGSLGVMMMFRARLIPAGSGFAPIAASPGAGSDTGWLWVVAVGLVIALLAAMAGLIVKGRRTGRGANGGSAMTMTTDKPQVDKSVQKLHTTNRVLIVAVVVLALLAIGLGGWAIYQATVDDQVAAVPEDVAALLDTWETANNQNDGSVLDLYAIGGYHLAGTNRYTGEELAAELSVPGWDHEWTSEPFLIVDNDDGRYVVVRGLEISNDVVVANSAFVYEIGTDSDGQLEILQTNWIWQN
ncbi:MAG: hypothetical protein M3092_00015 [Actinomycetia bacterium]|nr:hypothetical protein [Actinomycetes bacterium]